jgi:hypothetical protein
VLFVPLVAAGVARRECLDTRLLLATVALVFAANSYLLFERPSLLSPVVWDQVAGMSAGDLAGVRPSFGMADACSRIAAQVGFGSVLVPAGAVVALAVLARRVKGRVAMGLRGAMSLVVVSGFLGTILVVPAAGNAMLPYYVHFAVIFSAAAAWLVLDWLPGDGLARRLGIPRLAVGVCALPVLFNGMDRQTTVSIPLAQNASSDMGVLSELVHRGREEGWRAVAADGGARVHGFPGFLHGLLPTQYFISELDDWNPGGPAASRGGIPADVNLAMDLSGRVTTESITPCVEPRAADRPPRAMGDFVGAIREPCRDRGGMRRFVHAVAGVADPGSPDVSDTGSVVIEVDGVRVPLVALHWRPVPPIKAPVVVLCRSAEPIDLGAAREIRVVVPRWMRLADLFESYLPYGAVEFGMSDMVEGEIQP